tara:strand:- start:9901 stop:10887 length:987 start_codon:yes stop_codon:yes gene_type:complete
MGLLDNVNLGQYYHQSGNSSLQPGDYQFVTLDNIINAFMYMYVGEDKIITKLSRTDAQFCGMRAIQEFSYDIFRSVKSQEIEVPNTLRMTLPHDYVNYIKVVRVDSNGIERVLYPTDKTSNPFAIEQHENGSYVMSASSGQFSYAEMGGDISGDNLQLDEQGTSQNWLQMEDANVFSPFASNTVQNYNSQAVNNSNSDDTTDIEIDNYGRRYGLDPQYAQSNGTFFIDNRTGFINFGSSLAGETIILKYVSDGLGTDGEMVVHKFCEEAVYKWMAYCILSTRSNIPPFIIQRFKKEKFAEGRKAKIRLSNIKIEEFTQILKGLSKPIK